MSEHKLRESNGCTVIDVAPAYTREVFLELLDVTREVVDRGRPRLILNMDQLPHITSEGIGLLVLVHDECTQAGGKMVLTNVPRQIERVLNLAGVVNFFSIYPDEPGAVEAIKAAVPDAKEKPEAETGVDAETAFREIVSEVIKSRRHQQVVDFLVKQTTKAISLDEIAGVTAIERPALEQIMQDLAAGGFVKREGESFLWEPSPEAEKKLDIFRKALSDPRLRPRVMAWTYAEEKKA